MIEDILNTAMNWNSDTAECLFSDYIQGQNDLKTKMRDRSITEWSRSSRGSIRESNGR